MQTDIENYIDKNEQIFWWVWLFVVYGNFQRRWLQQKLNENISIEVLGN